MLGGCGLTFAGRVNGENGNSTGFIFMVNFIEGGHLVTATEVFWYFCPLFLKKVWHFLMSPIRKRCLIKYKNFSWCFTTTSDVSHWASENNESILRRTYWRQGSTDGYVWTEFNISSVESGLKSFENVIEMDWYFCRLKRFINKFLWREPLDLRECMLKLLTIQV